jgi:predicted aspartyl protease
MATAMSVEPQPGVKTMRKIVELKVEEAKAVIGGARYAASVAASSVPVVTTSTLAKR